MKKKEFQEIKTKPVPELQKMMGEFKDKLWTVKNDLIRGKVKNIQELKNIKKDIARLMTLMNQQKVGK